MALEPFYVVRKSQLTCFHQGQVQYLPVGSNPGEMAAKLATAVAELFTQALDQLKKELEEQNRKSPMSPTKLAEEMAKLPAKAVEIQKSLIRKMPAAMAMPSTSPVVWHVEDSPVVTKEDLLERAFIVGCVNVGPGLKPCTKIVQVLPPVLSRIRTVEGVHPEETPVLDLLNQMMISGTVTDSTPPSWLVILPPMVGVNQETHNESTRPFLVGVDVPDIERPEKEKKTQWVEIEFKNSKGKPLANVRYVMNLPNGSVKKGRTNSAGVARVEGIDGGSVRVHFPDYDGQSWEKK